MSKLKFGKLAATSPVFGVIALAGCVASMDPRIEPARAVASAVRVDAGEKPSLPLAEAWKDESTWPRRWGMSSLPPSPDRRATSAPTGASDVTIGRWGLVQAVKGPVLALRQGEDQRKDMEQEMLADINTLMSARGRGWYRWSGGAGSLTVKGETTGAFVFTTDKTADPKRVKSPTEPALYYKFISGTRDESGSIVRMQRTWFAYYDPLGYGPFDQTPPTACPGVAVVVPGMFGTPASIISELVHSLRARGWAVLRMLSHPSRFTEQATFVLEENAPADEAARIAADLLGDRAAECAYAIEDVMPVIVRERPMLKGLPRVALGASGGAMVLPTIVARNPDAYAAAVMVGGGADFLCVALESNYGNWIDALRFRRPSGEALTLEQAENLICAYRKIAPLDSLYTARSLVGKPVLMLQGSEDRAVPSHLGTELWEAAGQPERWMFELGHELLFLAFPMHLGRVNAWLERHVTKPVRSEDGAGE